MRWLLWERLIKNSRDEDADTIKFEIATNESDWLKENRTSFSITWIGHSSMLIQIDGLNILTDPILSDRASPVGFAGPRRLVDPGLSFEELPDIDIVLISHDHYDHLDKETIEKLGNKPLYLIPLALADFFDDLGITNYQELDWWDEIRFNQVLFACVPAQHFSGRTLFDRNKTLWSGWVISGRQAKIYYAGDTGYFPGFKEIGQRYGPFDVAFLPIGAYKPRWFMKPVHINPVEAVDAYLDVKARYFFPIHWGTFVLADEPMNEPPKMLLEEVKKRNLDASLFKILKHGETFKYPVKDIVLDGGDVTY
jgi:N-acyl-phosphatidylethanolamine-hydrolysing phospholipase D